MDGSLIIPNYKSKNLKLKTENEKPHQFFLTYEPPEPCQAGNFRDLSQVHEFYI